VSLNPTLLRESFEIAAEHEGALTKRFYELFFSRYPQVQSMFGRNAPAQQQKMLQDTLLAVLDHLDDPTWLSETLANLGATHVDYEVQDHMYPWVGECLIAALGETVGERWTPEHAAAWADAYAAISSLAIAGAEKRRASVV
jgi:hemoglobin-like flavoprotein